MCRVYMCRVCYVPSLLWAEFVMCRVDQTPKNESKCVPEQVVTPYLLQCCPEINTNGLILKDMQLMWAHRFTTNPQVGKILSF